MPSPIHFLKGHGTENDFVLVPDLDASIELGADAVARICDRHAGIGADGVLRVVRADGDAAGFFMDYRNADGSIAEMCGNGLRVFGRYLVEAGLEQPGAFTVQTRAGVRTVTVPADGSDITATMGSPVVRRVDGLRVCVGDHGWDAVDVDLGNPHAVVFVDDLAHVGSLFDPPRVLPVGSYPHGVNVEFVVDRGPRHIAMRVHERGSGETRSCGTGACAAAAAAAVRTEGADASGRWTVEVPGGRLRVDLHPDGSVDLTGPAVIVGEGTLRAVLGPTS